MGLFVHGLMGISYLSDLSMRVLYKSIHELGKTILSMVCMAMY